MNFVCRDTVIGIGVEEEDRKHTWMEDANSVSTKSNQHILYHNYPHISFVGDMLP